MGKRWAGLDLNLKEILPDTIGTMANVVHQCGCRAYWWVSPGNWAVCEDTPWRICSNHRDALCGVPRPVDDGGGFPWVYDAGRP